jgi:UV DNA damage repair endonuclease
MEKITTSAKQMQEAIKKMQSHTSWEQLHRIVNLKSLSDSQFSRLVTENTKWTYVINNFCAVCGERDYGTSHFHSN